MSRLDPDDFDGQELARVFLAVTLAEARRAEVILTERGVHYLVRPEVVGRTLLGSERVGAVFYVQTAQAGYCGAALAAAGLGDGVILDD